MTLLDSGKRCMEDPRLAAAAKAEKIDACLLARKILDGSAAIPWALGHELARPVAVGDGLKIKVNANLGTSPDKCSLGDELAKLKAAVDAGADAVMDLSTGGNIREVRKRIRDACQVSLGSVPVYEAGCMAVSRGGTFNRMTESDMLEAVRLHVEDGVDFVTIHCGLTRQAVKHLEANPRICGITSRGGSLLARWMLANGRENPLYERFDEVLDICRERDVVISLGDALRPGALADAGDRAQLHELYTLGELAQRAKSKGVQAIIEGPGHVPLDQIAVQMRLEKIACHNAPFYVLGPLVTDIAPGYDHLVSAIGAALAGTCGANFICYVTPAEHLRLPDAEDVRQGIMAARIAAHAADIANGLPGARDWDDAMSRARKARDWEEMFKLAIDPELARNSRALAAPRDPGVCSMCGDFCAMKDNDGPL